MLVYWFLPMILFLGIVTSYEDIKFGKIRNKWIVLGLIYVALVYFLLYFFYVKHNLDLKYITFLLINGILALITGFLIWFLGLWTAGDAKLFFVYTLLIPPISFRNINFVFTDILVNTFVPIGTFLFFFVAIRTSIKEKIFYVKEAFNPKKLIKLALFIFVLIWVLNKLTTFIPFIENIMILIIFILIVLLHKFEKLLSFKIVIIIAILALLRILLDKNIFSVDMWLSFFLIVIVLVIIRLFLVGISSSIFTKKVSLKKIKKGMMPAEIIYKHGKVYRKERISFWFFGIPNTKNKLYLFQPKPEGFSKEDIKKIKSLSKFFKFRDIQIRETISFAPFLFLGVILQILLKDNIISYIRNLLEFLK